MLKFLIFQLVLYLSPWVIAFIVFLVMGPFGCLFMRPLLQWIPAILSLSLYFFFSEYLLGPYDGCSLYSRATNSSLFKFFLGV